MNRKATAWAAAVIAVAASGFVAIPAIAAPSTGDASTKDTKASAQELARQIQGDNGISLLDSHVGGQNHPESTARQNIADTADGGAASTSPWSDVGVTKVNLSTALLQGMVDIGQQHDYRVTTIAGGDHSSTSFHYAGTAFDVDQIDGEAVGAGNPKVDQLMAACTDLGAVEVLGPGDAGHDTHVHCAWQS
jgi:hypothetical protein